MNEIQPEFTKQQFLGKNEVRSFQFCFLTD